MPRHMIAHSANEAGWPQPLLEHLEEVAKLAGHFAESFESRVFAEWLGWWHDAGKVAFDVQVYLNNPDAKPPGPDHSSAGMLAAFDAFELLAFNVAGHHGGLSDKTNLLARSQRKKQEQRVTDALAMAKNLLQDKAPTISRDLLPLFLKPQETGFHLRIECWLRMLHSTLVDADCLDTERHFNPEQYAQRGNQIPLTTLRDTLLDKQQILMAGATGPLNVARAKIYEACLVAAPLPPGIFSLTVPTGGGKTRSAMAFALEHACRHQLHRVIVALPYTSIIDQNAEVYRAIFGAGNVLEHHSAVEGADTPGQESEQERRRRLASQNWDIPIVVTTTVQLLESLFTNRNTRCRKLHNITRSVIILDEVQTLPPRLLRPTLHLLQHLVDAYGITLLLCTATQPAFVTRPGFKGFDHVHEIIAEPASLYQQLKRVNYILPTEQWTWRDVSDHLVQVPQSLVILNTIRDAMSVLDEIEEPHVYHLSTQLCGAHRRQVLQTVQEHLTAKQPVHLVSTQVIEAGVDIDFPLVLRALGPLDHIIQAAGRCNRENKLETGHMIVFKPEDGHLPPEAYKAATQQTKSLFTATPDLDLHDPALPLIYFDLFYQTQRLDALKIEEKQAGLLYEQTAAAYRLINDNTIPVVVPYDAGPHQKRRTNILRRIKRNGRADREDYRALQPYLVNLRHYVHQKAQREGLCRELVTDLWVWEGTYDELRGIQFQAYSSSDLVI